VLILSKNKDYYDGVVGTMGVDKTLVYERTEIEIEEKTEFPEPFKYNKRKFYIENKSNFIILNNFDTNSKKYFSNSFFLVGFCGKHYLGWKMFYKKKEFDGSVNQYVDIVKYDIIYGYENVKKHLKDNRWDKNLYDSVQHVLKYDPINTFRTINSPIFVYDGGIGIKHKDWNNRKSKFVINPILKEYEFYKEVDAFTAFQEVQMFLGGVLGTGEKEIVQVDDKYKIPQHGFDKWSFRRKSSKK
jgi:hypothetical protein